MNRTRFIKKDNIPEAMKKFFKSTTIAEQFSKAPVDVTSPITMLVSPINTILASAKFADRSGMRK